MSNNYFKSLYRVGLTIFVVICIISSLTIYGVLKMSVEPVMVSDADTVYQEKEIIKIVKDTIRINQAPTPPPQPRPIQVPKPVQPKIDTVVQDSTVK